MDPMQYGLKAVDFGNPRPARTGLDRRGFLSASLASGFALAAGPAAASTITTDTEGLTAGEISLRTDDGEIPAYRAMPEAGKDLPLLLVIQEIFGVHEHIRDVCRRYAKQGYYAVAPALFHRQGDVSGMSDVDKILSEVVAKVPDAQVMADLDATVAQAAATGHVDAGRLGIIGFCWGGRTVWLYAHHNPEVAAGVAYYGLVDGMQSEIKPRDPVDIAAELTVPVLGLYAGADEYIQRDALRRMRAELLKSESGSEIVVFPGVDHGFNADYRPSYDAAAADYARRLARDWLTRHGA
jgi:carboxymethylenebutenolidase